MQLYYKGNPKDFRVFRIFLCYRYKKSFELVRFCNIINEISVVLACWWSSVSYKKNRIIELFNVSLLDRGMHRYKVQKCI